MPAPNNISNMETPNLSGKEIEKSEKENRNESLETTETKTEAVSEAEKTSSGKEVLKQQSAEIPAETAAGQKKEDLTDARVKESMEKRVGEFYKRAIAANFDPGEVQKIFKDAEKYITKGYSHIYDETHDRICAEIDRRAEANLRSGGSH
jgi:hypothetical protein